MSGVSVTFRNIYIKFQLFQINVAHCVQKMSNLTQLTASLTSKYNLHHTFSHAPRPQIILKLKATIFKENISNSNGVDTTSNNFSDNINKEEDKVQSYDASMSGERDKTSKNNAPLSPRKSSSIQLRQRIFFLLEALFERVLQRMSSSSEPNWRLRILSVPSMSELIARKWVLYWFP